MHLLRRLRRNQTVQRLPELRRRLCAAPDPTHARMARRRVRRQAGAIGRAGTFEIFGRGSCGICSRRKGRGAGGAMTYPLVIASAAKQSRATLATLDCFVASPLAM